MAHHKASFDIVNTWCFDAVYCRLVEDPCSLKILLASTVVGISVYIACHREPYATIISECSSSARLSEICSSSLISLLSTLPPRLSDENIPHTDSKAKEEIITSVVKPEQTKVAVKSQPNFDKRVDSLPSFHLSKTNAVTLRIVM